jgi:hypothetical protein
MQHLISVRTLLLRAKPEFTKLNVNIAAQNIQTVFNDVSGYVPALVKDFPPGHHRREIFEPHLIPSARPLAWFWFESGGIDRRLCLGQHGAFVIQYWNAVSRYDQLVAILEKTCFEVVLNTGDIKPEHEPMLFEPPLSLSSLRWREAVLEGRA